MIEPGGTALVGVVVEPRGNHTVEPVSPARIWGKSILGRRNSEVVALRQE